MDSDGLFAGRYQILGLLGKGGMGVVYKAFDARLKRHVALKFLPADLALDQAKERFWLEARAAAALSHPNICTVHEIDEADGQSFISMEFVEGRSLREILKSGPLPMDKALAIAIQVAEGLVEAHEKGVIHRDIKSANVMINDKGVAKIMDFGMAKLCLGIDLTLSTMIMGTVHSMSPEQARGEAVDRRTDIWSFGVLLYEMLTGHLPFKGENEQAVLCSICNAEPEPLTHVPEAAAKNLGPVIKKTLSKDRDKRYQSMRQLLEDLRKVRDGADLKAAVRVRRMGRPVLFAAAVLALLIAAYLLVKRPLPPQQLAPGQRRSIAVMYFENLSADPAIDWMQKGVAELLNAGLSRSEELRLLDSQRLFEILEEMGKSASSSIDTKSAAAVARRAGIETMILGNIIKVGPKICIQSKVVDARTGEILLAEQADGKSVEDSFAMVASLTASIRNYLEVKSAGEKVDETWLKNVTTSSVEAYRYFIEGRELVYQSKWKEAKHLFQKAIALDPDFAIAYIDLAAADWNLGDYPSMGEAFAYANRLRDKVSLKEKLWIDIFGEITSRNHEKAIPLLKEFLKFDPENKFSLYLLGRSYYFSGQTEKAVDTWSGLEDKGWNWVWIYYYLSQAQRELGNSEAAAIILKKGIEAVPDPAILYAESAAVSFLSGDAEGSRLQHQRFLAEMRELPDDAADTFTIAGRGYLGDQMFQEARECFEEGSKAFPRDSRLRIGLGRANLELGDLPAALEECRQALEINPEEYGAHYWLGLIYEKMGKLEPAAEELTKYIELQKEGEDVEDAKNRLRRLQEKSPGIV